jgi:hypothetical protein
MSIEARDDGLQKLCHFEFFKIQRMTRMTSNERQKCELRAAIAITKWMDGIQFRETMRGFLAKFIQRKAHGKRLLQWVPEYPCHLRCDILGIAEHAAISGNPDGAEAACPSVDIPENMAMNRAIVHYVQIPGGQGFRESLCCHIGFKSIKPGLVSQPKPVFQDIRALVAIGIDMRFIQPDQAFRRCLEVIAARLCSLERPSRSKAANILWLS